LKNLLALGALLEAATGLALLISPSLLVRLLLGAEIAGTGIVMSRFCGISLVALGAACWPRTLRTGALCGMLTYNALAALFLVYLGLRGEWSGLLLWPAAILHVVLACLFTAAWFNERKAATRRPPGWDLRNEADHR
jgi:Na+/proline symporter